MSESQRDVHSEFKALRLNGMASAWADLMEQDGGASIQSSRWLIEHLLQAEDVDRHMRSIAHQMKAARFPIHRDLAGFDFDVSPVDKALIKKLADLSFTDDAQNVVLIGGPGTGKTHLLIGLGLAAFTVLVWSWLDGRRHGWSALWAWGLAVLVGTLVFGSREVWVAMEAAADPQGPTNIVLRTVISVLSLAVQTLVLAGVGVALGAGLGSLRARGDAGGVALAQVAGGSARGGREPHRVPPTRARVGGVRGVP